MFLPLNPPPPLRVLETEAADASKAASAAAGLGAAVEGSAAERAQVIADAIAKARAEAYAEGEAAGTEVATTAAAQLAQETANTNAGQVGGVGVCMGGAVCVWVGQLNPPPPHPLHPPALLGGCSGDAGR